MGQHAGVRQRPLDSHFRANGRQSETAIDDKAELQEYDFEAQKRTLVAACECGRDRPIAASALNQTFRQINEFKGLNVAPAATISIPAPRKKLNATKRRSIVTQGTVFHEHTACHM